LKTIPLVNPVLQEIRHPFSCSICYSVLLIPLIALGNKIPFDPALIALNPAHTINLLGVLIFLSLPFFLAGLVIILIIKRYPNQAYQIYCCDLAGAATGCFGFVFIAPFLKEFEWLLVLTCIASFASLLFSNRIKRGFLGVIPALFFIVLYTVYPSPALEISYYKPLSLAENSPGFRHLRTSWDSATRVDWFESPLARSAPGLSLRYEGNLPDQIGITLDGDQLSTFFTPESVQDGFLNDLPSWFTILASPMANNSLILQTTGGLSIQSELISGVDKIVVQTENLILADWLRQEFRSDRITFHAENARSFLQNLSGQFDRIIISMDGALPTGDSGMISLQGNSLLTEEGIKELIGKLSQEGWLSFHLYLLPPTRAEYRLLLTLTSVISSAGWNAGEHLGVFRTISTMMIVIKAHPWKESDKILFRNFCNERGYALVYYPGMRLEEANQANRFSYPVFAEAAGRIMKSPHLFIKESAFDLRPVRDDKPFFYHFLRLDKIPEFYALFDGKWEALVEGGLLLPLIWCLVFILSLVLIIAPFLFTGTKLLKRPSLPFYFLCLGFGFMMVEIALLEKLILFLGQPTLSFALVLGILLISSGIGSWVFKYRSEQQKSMIHFVLIILLIFYYLFFNGMIECFAGLGFVLRLLISVLLICLPGLIMGMPFPRAIVKLSGFKESHHAIFAAWSFNSFASILGSVTAMILAVFNGFSGLFLWAVLFYFIAWVLYSRIR